MTFSGKFRQIAGAINKNPFDKVRVQEAKLAEAIPKDGDWVWELKYDGYRIVAFCENGEVKLQTRGGLDWATRFPSITNSLLTFAGGRAFVLDGELVVVDDDGRSDFNALQNFSKKPKESGLIYMVFDVLALDGEDLRERPLWERKKTLEKLMEGAPKNLVLSQARINGAEFMLAAICSGNFEGLIGKLLDSTYAGKRNGAWLKLKCENYKRSSK